MREKRDLYTKDGELTNKTYYKGDIIPDNYYPMVVMISIENYNNEFLMQKRVPEKGGDWGVTGGHPKSGETPYEGIISEVSEELGIDISNNIIQEFESGWDGKECYKMYYTKLDLDISKLNIQKEELTEVRWFTIDKLKEMVKTKELNENQVAFFEKSIKFLNNK